MLEVWQLKHRRLIVTAVFVVTLVVTSVSMAFAVVDIQRKSTLQANPCPRADERVHIDHTVVIPDFGVCLLAERPLSLIVVYIHTVRFPASTSRTLSSDFCRLITDPCGCARACPHPGQCAARALPCRITGCEANPARRIGVQRGMF